MPVPLYSKVSMKYKLHRLTKQLLSVPQWLYLSLVVVIGAIARLLSITKADIWHDEGYTMMLITHAPLDIIERTARDVHPPLYYLAAHIWQSIFGMSELAVRSLSAVFGLATIALVYFLVRRLFSEGTARLAALFVALGPFVIRYSEEARMYGMASFFVVLATYLIVRIATDKVLDKKLWIFYGLVIAAGLYTHYYTLFIIPVHIVYLAWCKGGIKALLTDRNWWIGNGLGALLFLPWVPAALAQMSRVQAGFWIPPVTIDTAPGTFMQFLAFLPSYAYAGWISGALLTLFIIGIVHTYLTRKNLRRAIGLLILWLVVPLALVMLISIVRPVYYDRYFIYCAVAMYILFAVIITRSTLFTRNIIAQYSVTAIVILIFIGGIQSVNLSATHKMGTVGQYVSQMYQPGDLIISADLYTYFDFSYYNRTGQTTHFLSKTPLDGYGETSLIYDRQDDIRIASFYDIKNTPRVWVVGKVGEKDYFTTEIPYNWRLADQLEAGDSAVRLYTIGE